ncbi:pyridoxal phosphate-dependent aminotransferase [Larkinella humicola]|uniref:Histidinol-phosphate aminotransferase family protein n=1 Tax=Larkinella humicola TaxID=2607654 RepID=A0A5N1JGB3_9BACT|nr:histidinol-phosphate transaminase [Larkinella humicola]KAA9353537.1 histidinol-phosphate aminotransferase family protein [Larkinella humicola]
MSLNRREWLRSGLLAGVGLAAAPAAYCEPWLDKAAPAGVLPPTAPKGALKARLSANENPYGPSPKALKAINEAASDGFLYPFSYGAQLQKMIADEEGVAPEQILLSAGSGALLHATALQYAYASPGSSVLSADPTYESLVRAAVMHGMTWDKVPLTSGSYDHNLEEMEKKVNDKTGLVYICNPNNPTGVTINPESLRAFVDRVSAKKPVFVDEAYIHYTGDPKKYTVIENIKKGQNVMVAKTFSKIYGMAGLRMGYMVGQPDTLKAISKWGGGAGNLSMTTLRAALACYKDEEFIKYSLGKGLEAREFLYATLKQNGYTYLPSGTNFVLFPIRMKGDDFTKKMMENGVSVRQWKFDGQFWCRVSLGTMDQMKYFADALKVIS